MGGFVFLADRPVSESGKIDVVFLMLFFLLWGLGLYTQFICTQEKAMSFMSSKYYFFNRQLIFSAVGFVAMAAVSLVPMKIIRKAVPLCALLIFALCVVTIIFADPTTQNGAARWLQVGGVSIQASEFVKFFLVLYLAHLFVKHHKEYEENNKEFAAPLFALFAFVMVIFLQRDFSTSILVLTVGIAMFVACGVKVLFLVPFLLFLIPAGIFMILSEEYRIKRLLSFMHPELYSTNEAFQFLSSQNAIRAGGFWGTGTGSGMNLVPRIPEIQSDYIFAGFANSMGLLGVTIYILILILFSLRGFKIAFNCPNKFASYSSFGLVFAILIQSLLNIAVVSGSVPTTGIPLPFFSAGGSSLVSVMMSCGFVLNASQCKADNEDNEENNFVSNENEFNSEEIVESFNGVSVEYE